MPAPAAQSAPAGSSLECESCGAVLEVPAGLRTARCPYCASPAVIETPRSADVDRATFVLGFVVTEEDALARARKYIRSSWFTPTAFAKADVTLTRGVYVPAYLYTAAADVAYSASIGENYTVVETYTTTNSKGQTVTRTRTKTKTEWRSLTGQWQSYLDDIVVTASRGLANQELEAVEPFDLRALVRYTPKVLSGWIAEDPSIASGECHRVARAEAQNSIAGRLAKHMPGNRHRQLKWTTQVSQEDLELVLLPVWVLAVRYDEEKPPIRIIINGQTGALAGSRPRSWLKIVLTVVSVLGAVGLAYTLLSI